MKKIILALSFLLFVQMFVYAENIQIPFIEKEDKQVEYQKINWTPYMFNLEKSIKSNWKPASYTSYYKIVVNFIIEKNGELKDMKVITSSGFKELDSYALGAVKKTAPFDKLPEEFEGDSIPIEFTFEHNVATTKKFSKHSYGMKSQKDVVPAIKTQIPVMPFY